MISSVTAFAEYWQRIHTRTREMVAAIPEESLDWRPAEGEFSCAELVRHIASARRNIDRISAQDGVGIVSVVGSRMKAVPGIAAKVFGALGRAMINVISIAQGSSEHNMSLVLDEGDLNEAVRLIHAEFELGTPVAEGELVTA